MQIICSFTAIFYLYARNIKIGKEKRTVTMLKIIICCGGGFSSSALAAHLEKEVHEKHLEERASFEFVPFIHLRDRKEPYDIAMLCPHLQSEMLRLQKESYPAPLYFIPPRLYGLMNAESFIEDAEDIIALWKQKPATVVTFPDEPRPLAVRRMTSHRRWLQAAAR